jgi:hypothetical protein
VAAEDVGVRDFLTFYPSVRNGIVSTMDDEPIGLTFLPGWCGELRANNAALRAHSAALRARSAALDCRSVELEQRCTALLARSAALVARALGQGEELKSANGAISAGGEALVSDDVQMLAGDPAAILVMSCCCSRILTGHFALCDLHLGDINGRDLYRFACARSPELRPRFVLMTVIPPPPHRAL